jgi:hypothetical protein
MGRWFWVCCLFWHWVNPTPGVTAGLFDAGEVQVAASPHEVRTLALRETAKPVDFDVSPAGPEVALVVREASGKHRVDFWKIDTPQDRQANGGWDVPRDLIPRSIAWHPLGSGFFLTGTQGGQQVIMRVTRSGNAWQGSIVYRSKQELRRLAVGPRPFLTGLATDEQQPREAYRLFFGVKNADGTYAIRSITTDGGLEYQVIGPKAGAAPASDDATSPSELTARSALPLGFHPAGHLLLWEDEQHCFHYARYDRDHWGASARLLGGDLCGGTVTATPNGVGLIHWKPESDGVTILYDQGKTRSVQAAGYRFSATPSSVPDGRGLVGLTRTPQGLALVYVPIEVPLADVANAWMFLESPQDRELFSDNGGLLRGLEADQLYALYESEAYECGDYDASTPSRPYLVTTDIFWELLAAAYEGLFIVTERQQAIPAFWEFVAAAARSTRETQPVAPWSRVFTALETLRDPRVSRHDEEAQRILRAQGRECSSLFDTDLDYEELKPRGHYTADKALQTYFQAFKYLTQLAPEVAPPEDLQRLPAAVKAKAVAWLQCYQPFIAGARAPLVWTADAAAVPAYARHPEKELRLFPLSWGFDNEVLLSTVYHADWPEVVQIKGPSGPRLNPSGLDIAAALGSNFALQLLAGECDRYPSLKAVLEELRARASIPGSAGPGSANLYDRWITALAVQWAENVASPNGRQDEPLWRAKRLQTGLASWATLRHATVLVNERTTAECGESGFEPLLMRPPRGYVEPDPRTFEAIAGFFDELARLVKAENLPLQGDIEADDGAEAEPLRQAMARRLGETAAKARLFQAMAAKELRGEALTSQEYEEILYVGRVAEHHLLIFKSLANKEYALSTPDPLPKIADVAGGGPQAVPLLMAAVGRPLEWDHIVPFFGRREIVKGSVYAYYEFISETLLNDADWLQRLPAQPRPSWITAFVSRQAGSCPARNPY